MGEESEGIRDDLISNNPSSDTLIDFNRIDFSNISQDVRGKLHTLHPGHLKSLLLQVDTSNFSNEELEGFNNLLRSTAPKKTEPLPSAEEIDLDLL